MALGRMLSSEAEADGDAGEPPAYAELEELRDAEEASEEDEELPEALGERGIGPDSPHSPRGPCGGDGLGPGRSRGFSLRGSSSACTGKARTRSGKTEGLRVWEQSGLELREEEPEDASSSKPASKGPPERTDNAP